MKVWQLLGYLGLIPFILFLWLFDNHIQDLPIKPQQAFVFYSATILSFVAGSLWRRDNSLSSKKLQLISNAFCLYAFTCLLLPLYMALLLLPLGYLLILSAEYILLLQEEHLDFDKEKDILIKHYFTMRFILTMIVSLLHAVAFICFFNY
jgi:hypothetical protein